MLAKEANHADLMILSSAALTPPGDKVFLTGFSGVAHHTPQTNIPQATDLSLCGSRRYAGHNGEAPCYDAGYCKSVICEKRVVGSVLQWQGGKGAAA